jgi:PAT family beta-lactamase induction signal transducer AmpG
MIWAGAGTLWIAARSEIAMAIPVYQYAAWQTAYLVMAASMLPGVLTVLLSKEPASSVGSSIETQESLRLSVHFRRNGVPMHGVFIFATQILWILVWIGVNFRCAFAGYPLVSPLEAMGVPVYLANFPSVPFLSPRESEVLAYSLLVLLYAMSILMLIRTHKRWPLVQPLNPAAVWFTRAFYLPFAEFLRRYRWQAALILALIATYRISDVVMGIMANPFYVDMGYSKDEVAAVTKVFGVIMTLVGAFIGGAMALRMGVMRVLMLGALLSAASNLLFSWLAGQGHDVTKLVVVISADNLASGIASSAFIAYLSSLTNVNYSATQYAMFSSMMLLLPKFVAGYSGVYVDAFGYANFFTATALLGAPVLLLVKLASRVAVQRKSD